MDKNEELQELMNSVENVQHLKERAEQHYAKAELSSSIEELQQRITELEMPYSMNENSQPTPYAEGVKLASDFEEEVEKYAEKGGSDGTVTKKWVADFFKSLGNEGGENNLGR